MDVNTSGLSTGGYRGGHYYGGPGSAAPAAAATTGEEGAAEQPLLRTGRPTQFGDSLIGLELARKAPAKSEFTPDQVLKAARITRGVCCGIAAVSSFAFLTIFLQPVLLPLFTFGACFSGGFSEWLQFSFEVLKVSVVPLVIGIASGWGGYFSHKKIQTLAQTATSSPVLDRPSFLRS
jgi:hypothetical protein